MIIMLPFLIQITSFMKGTKSKFVEIFLIPIKSFKG